MTNESSGLSLLDHSLNAALLLSYVALRQGDSVGVIAFADRVLSFVPPRGGMKQMNQLLHASFNRFPELVESRYDDAFLYLNSHCKKRSLVVLVTNVIDEVNAHQIESYLRNVAGRHLPLGVILRDHRLFDAADRDPTSDEQLFEAAAASEILTWRHQVLRESSGAWVASGPAVCLHELFEARAERSPETTAVVCSTLGEGGAWKQVQSRYEFFNQFEKIIVCMDADDAGKEGAEKICKVLPKVQEMARTLGAATGSPRPRCSLRCHA